MLRRSSLYACVSLDYRNGQTLFEGDLSRGLTPTEALTAWEAAPMRSRFFCGNVGGQIYQGTKGPLPHIAMIPTGGVNGDCGRLPEGGVAPSRWVRDGG